MLIILCIALSASAQKSKYEAGFSSVDVSIGQHLYSQSFYELNTLKHFKLAAPVTIAGIGISGIFDYKTGKRAGSYSSSISYHHILPQNIKIDSTDIKIMGFNVAIGVWGMDILHRLEKADIIVSAGINTGRLRIRESKLVQAKNPLLSPKISVMPRVRLGRIALSACAEYGYDISFAKWRKLRFADDVPAGLDKFRQSGLNCVFSLGYVISK